MANTYPRADAAAGALIDSDYNIDTPDYNSLLNKVYDWSNRDIAALPVSIVKDSVRYAADTAYRTLRVPPLEATLIWTNGNQVDGIGDLDRATAGSNTIYQSVTSLAIPADLVEFIQIRGTDVDGLTTRVFNEKTDIRTFQDVLADTYSRSAFWARQGNNVLFTPSFGNAARGFYGGGAGSEDQIEMYYYRRLPALNAQYTNTFNNWMSGFVTFTPTAAVYNPTMTLAENQLVYDAIPSTSVPTGTEVPHWLRDENEKAVLMGGLAECFAYLQEDDQATKYLQLFQKEITELNDEDKMRDASGGNVQVHYSSRGLI